ncbi:cytochrome b5 reductase 4-like isoform X2 [Littorina saxatilis]
MAGKSTKNSLFPATNSPQRLGNSFGGSPKAQNKVALKPGRSLMDWIRLGRSGVDLTGVGGKTLNVTTAELLQHNTPDDAWIALRGKVYNISPYLEYHPGGVDELMRGAGVDGTQLFDEIHKWVNAESMLEKCYVGKLEAESPISKGGMDRKGSNKASSLGPNGTVSIATLKPPDPETPTYDWFQSSKVVTVAIYTRWKKVLPEHVTIDKNSKNLRVTVLIEKHLFKVHLELEEDVGTDYTVKTHAESGKVEIILPKYEPEKQWTSLGKPLRGDMSYVKAMQAETVYRECTVKSVSVVSHDVVLLAITPPEGCRLPVPLGHHVQIKHNCSGMELARSYTVVLPSLEPERQDPDVETGRVIYLMIKIYSNGAVTPYIGTLNAGDTLSVGGSVGTFQLSQLSGVSHLVLLAAGTGFTPMIRLIYHTVVCAPEDSTLLVHLVFYNKKMCDILWREQLDVLAKQYDRFRVTYVLSAEDETVWDGLTGHICATHVQQYVPHQDNGVLKENQNSQTKQKCSVGKVNPLVCACGPPVFTAAAIELLKAHGLTSSHIHAFSG